jgi:hypothetical protein
VHVSVALYLGIGKASSHAKAEQPTLDEVRAELLAAAQSGAGPGALPTFRPPIPIRPANP